MLIAAEYTAKVYTVEAVEVTTDNAAEVAAWAGGTVEKMEYRLVGASTYLPCVHIPGSGSQKGKTLVAPLGYWVVKNRRHFRVYKPNAFNASFEKKASFNVDEEFAKGVLTHEELKSAFESSSDIVEVKINDKQAVVFEEDGWVRVTNPYSDHYQKTGFMKALRLDDGKIDVEFDNGSWHAFAGEDLERYSVL